MKETIRKEFYRLSNILSTEQLVLELIGVFGAESVAEFLKEEAEKKKNE